MAKPKAPRAKRATRSNPRYDRNQMENVIELHPRKRKKVELIPRTANQEEYIENMLSDTVDVCVASGSAGSGKTMLATMAAIKGLQEGRYERIVITRPNVEVDDRSIGFLPGTMTEKMAPWMMPIMDVFSQYYSKKEIEQLMEESVLVILPLCFIRGLTISRSFFILDEAQGTTQNSLKAALTRIGEGTKMVITGDTAQSDIGANNGLSDFLRRFNGSSRIAVTRFTNKDIQRHPVIDEVLKLYGE